MARPSCGINIPGGNTSGDKVVTGTVSAVFTAAGVASSIWAIVKAGSAAAIWAPYAAAVVAGIIVVAIVIYFTVERCNKPDGTHSCMAGVIQQLTPAFTGSAWDEVFSFASPHDRVDVVVKQIYWDFIEPRSDFVFCSTNDSSPMVPCFYYTPAVCNAGVGASVGAAVGAVAGILLAAVLIAAIGCATWILCIFAILIALILVVAAAILGAVAGGQIGQAASEHPGPSSTGNDLIPSQPLEVGDYVSVDGSMLKSGDLDNALVFYFVENTTLHGQSLNSAPFSHTDPDANLNPDACPVEVPPIG